MDGGFPVIDVNNPGGACTSDSAGDVVIPNLGPDRYTATVVPPTGQRWYQTTTLEGNHDWDMWIAENETGFDTEQTVGRRARPAGRHGLRALRGPRIGVRRGACRAHRDQDHQRLRGHHQHLCRRQRRPDRAQRRRRGRERPGPAAEPDRHALRPRQQRPDGLRRPGSRRRHVHDRQRPGRQLPAHGVGRRAGLHHRQLQRHREPDRHHRRRRAEGPRRLVHEHPAARSSSTPTATASATRASRASRSSRSASRSATTP